MLPNKDRGNAANYGRLSYSLGSGAPAGVKIGTHRGVSYLAWIPTTAQTLTTNLITVVLTDSTNPNSTPTNWS